MKASIFLFVLVFMGLGCVKHPEPVPVLQPEVYFPKEQPRDTGIYLIWWSVQFREGYSSNVYICPGGKRSSGFGNTHNPKTTTEREAAYTLYDTLYYYYSVVSNKYPSLSEQQKWAVVSIAANCKWNSIFGKNSSFNRSLLNQSVPPFELYCYDGKGNKRMNLLQSRLYEKALFTHSDSLIWINPYRDYSDEETTVSNLQIWYKNHHRDRYEN